MPDLEARRSHPYPLWHTNPQTTLHGISFACCDYSGGRGGCSGNFCISGMCSLCGLPAWCDMYAFECMNSSVREPWSMYTGP